MKVEMPNYLIRPTEKNGKTLHLLKSSSKPAKSDRKRKKIPILGTFDQFAESKQKPVSNLPIQPSSLANNQSSGAANILNYMAPGPAANGPPPKNKDAKMSQK